MLSVALRRRIPAPFALFLMAALCAAMLSADTTARPSAVDPSLINQAVGATARQPSTDPELMRLNQAIDEHPESAAPLIARARYFFGKSYIDAQLKLSSLVVEWELFDDKGAAKLLPALDDLDRAVRLEPLSATPWIERGRVRLAYIAMASDRAAGKFVYEDAAKDFERAINIEPNNAEAWFETGRAHLVLWTTGVKSIMFGIRKAEGEEIAKRTEALRQAVAAFSRAIYLQPEAAGEAHFQRALVLRELASGGTDFNALLVDCSAAIAQKLKSTDAGWSAARASVLDEEPIAAALADMHYTRARLLRARGELTTALADLDEALALYEKVHLPPFLKDYRVNARFERGRLRVQRGDYDGALADLEVVTKQPAPAEAWEWRALAHDGKGEIDLARADFEEAFKRDPKLRAHVAGSRYDAQNPNPARGLAPKPVTADLHLVPPGTALDHKNAGNALRGKKDDEGALREYNLALFIDPEFADGLNNRGSLYQSRGMYDLALVDLGRAIQVDPKHRVAYLNRGLLWRNLDEHEKERADLDRAVEFATTDATRAAAYRARSWTRRIAKDDAGAEIDAQIAVQLAPTESAAWLELGHLQLNGKKFGEAAASYRQAIGMKSESWEAHAYLALVLALQDDETASAELRAALGASQAPQFALIEELLDRALNNHPESSRLKALKAQFESEQADRQKLKI